MCEISVIIPLCNNEKHVHNAVESVLNQSFNDFEIILTDAGSSDNTLSVVRSFDDRRIRIIAHNDIPNRICALNAGLQSSVGKYIAVMDADCSMHTDRLKIQHAFMEAEPSITVCASRIKQTGNQKTVNVTPKVPEPVGGLVENPLSAFLRGYSIIYSSVMMRKLFLEKHNLHYENYPDVEDFKFFTEIAKCGGRFYVDTQILLYCHAEENQEDKQKQTGYENIINEILQFMADTNPELSLIFASFKKLKEKNMLTQQDIVVFFHNFFMKNTDILSHG